MIREGTVYLPTYPAVLIANQCGLAPAIITEEMYDRFMIHGPLLIKNDLGYQNIPESEWREIVIQEINRPMDRLKTFQQLSFSGATLDIAIAGSYFGYDISDQQREALAIIHQLSRSWATGELATALMETMREKLSGKDKAQIAETIVAIMNGESPDDAAKGKKGRVGRTIKEFYMEFTTDESKPRTN